ncbi:MAG: hypothetical protein H5T74_03225 [Actinobacteria bacterium]|nr:hypothetical protein [Actinomycetota bacterium]
MMVEVCLGTAVAAAEGLGRDLFAVLVAAGAGIAVLLYAAASDLFELKLFKFDPYSVRLPKEARVEYWYTRAARRFEAFLAGGGWKYAKAKKQAKVRIKGDWRRLRRETRRMLPEAARRLNRDIAMGALAIAVVLVALLIFSLL